MVKEPTVDEIRRVVECLVVRRRVREAGGEHAVADCPFCGKRKHLYANLETGMWDCKAGACEESGNLWKLADRVGLRLRDDAKHVVNIATRTRAKSFPERRSRTRIGLNLDELEARLWDATDERGARALAYLRGRGLDDETVRRFRLFACSFHSDGRRHDGFGIPYLDGQRVTLAKMRNLEDDKTKRSFSRTKGGSSSLFNGDAIASRHRAVMVEGELDAISLWQCGVTDAVSTSLGAKKSIPDEWRQRLREVGDIVIWYDDDDAGQESAAALAESLGIHRVRLAQIPDALADRVEDETGRRPKDANDLLRAGVTSEEIRRVVDDARQPNHEWVMRPSAWTDVLARTIDRAEESLGLPIRHASIGKLLRGWRPGEMTLITGHTGHGKSTFAAQLGFDLAEDGHPVLMSSLENGPDTIVRKLVQRSYGKPLSTIRTDEERARAREALASVDRTPIWIVARSGRVELDDLASDVEYAAHRLGVRHVILDHLGYLRRPERVDAHVHLESALQRLIEIAQRLRLHLFVLAHPRGDVENTTVFDGDALKGGSSLKQIPDNGLTVFRSVDPFGNAVGSKQRLRDASGRKIDVDLGANQVLISVWKTRHDEAKEGCAILDFDPEDLRYSEVGAKKVTDEPEDPFLGI